MQQVDIAIIGAGPAGLTAALNAKIRNKSVALFSGDYRETGLYKAESLSNILGTPSMSGKAYLEFCLDQVAAQGVALIPGRVLSVAPMNPTFFIACGSDVYSAAAVILASGIVQTNTYPGEEPLLGRGVSYCATCDGMLYLNKQVCVVIRSNDAIEEANYLHEIGCTTTAILTDKRDITALNDNIPVLRGKKITIQGTDSVTALQLDDTVIPCQGVFVLRNSVAPKSLLPNLALSQDGHIVVDRQMQTNIPGVFSAGDCTGKPYQVAKATGEGLVAALAAVDYLSTQQKKES